MNSSASVTSIQVQLPDGSVREVAAGSTPYDVAYSISPRLASASVVARIKPLHPVAAPVTTGEAEEGAEAAMYAAADPNAERLVDFLHRCKRTCSCNC